MKLKMAFLGIVMLFALSINMSNASATCAAWQWAPEIPKLTYTKGPTVNVTTSENTCYGSNTRLWIYNVVAVAPGYYVQDGQEMYMQMYEEDPAAYKPDEYVKIYASTMQGRVLTNFRVMATYTSGSIDSTGDQTCELYLKFMATAYSDTEYGLPLGQQHLFDYELCMV